jgi:TonB family protein
MAGHPHEAYDRRRAAAARQRRIVALLLTALVYALGAVLLTLWSQAHPPSSGPARAPSTIEFSVVDPPAPEGLRAIKLPTPTEPEVVPREATAFDRYNRSVERETVARESRIATRGDASADAEPSPSRGAARGTPRPADTSDGASARRRGARIDATESPDTPGDRFVGVATPGQAEDGDGSGSSPLDGSSSALRGFNPTIDEPRLGSPQLRAGRSEAFEGIAEGDRTRINSLRSSYWAFFERTRARVERVWGPAAVLRRYDPKGTQFNDTDRMTLVRVTLTRSGMLAQAVVTRSSGLPFLDEEALRALRAGAPYPNVPEGLLNQFGEAEFDWGFYVYNGSFNMRWLFGPGR